MEKEAAAKFHHEGSPSYTKKLTSLALPTFVVLHPYTVKCTFHFSLHAALVLLLSALYSLPLILYSKHYYISQPSHLKLCYKTNCSSNNVFSWYFKSYMPQITSTRNTFLYWMSNLHRFQLNSNCY